MRSSSTRTCSTTGTARAASTSTGCATAGYTVLLEIDWQGAQQVRERAPDAQTIFILPPNAAELERRLRARATDSEADDPAHGSAIRSAT